MEPSQSRRLGPCWSFSKVFGLIWGHSLPGEEGLLETTWTEAQLGGMAPQGRASWAHHCHCHLQTAETRTWEGMCPTALVRPPSAGTTTWEDPQVAVGPHALPPGSSSHPTWEIMMGPQVNDTKCQGLAGAATPAQDRWSPASMTQCPVTSGPSGAFLATPYSGETVLLGGPQSQGCSGSGARGPWEPRLLPAALPQVVHLRGCRRAGAGEISIQQCPPRAKLRPAQAPPIYVRALPGPGPAQAPPTTLRP